MSVLRTARLVAGKDLRAFFRDRAGVLLGFLLPVALVTVFGTVMSYAFGSGGGMPAPELHVADEDGSASSAAFVRALRAAGGVRVRPRAGGEPMSAAEVRQEVEDGEAHHALVIEAGFGAALEVGEIPPLTMYRDPGRVNEDTVLGFALMAAFMEVTEGRLWPRLFGASLQEQGMPEHMVEGIVVAAETTRALIESWAGPDGDEVGRGSAGGGEDEGAGKGGPAGFDVLAMMQSMVPLRAVDIAPPDRPKTVSYMQAQSVAGITVMMLMFGLAACGATLIREREHGTLPRLLVYSPASSGILLGKFAFTAIVGMIQLAILFTWGEVIFGLATFSDPVTLLVLCLSTVSAVSAFGVLIAAWARTEKQAEGFSTLLILVMSCLGGAWFPIQMFDLPIWLEAVQKSTLTHWAMITWQGMFWHRASWTESAMLLGIGVQWGFAVVATALAVRLYRRNYISA